MDVDVRANGKVYQSSRGTLTDRDITTLVNAAKRAYIRKGDARGTVGCNLQLAAFRAKREINAEQARRARERRAA